MDYKIKSGDTLSGIAQKFNTTVKGLLSANPGIKDPDKIYAGKSLNIPEMVKNAIPNPFKVNPDLPLPFQFTSRTPPGMMQGFMGNMMGLPAEGYPLPLRMMAQIGQTVTGPGSDGPIEPVAGLEQLLPFIGKAAPVGASVFSGSMRNPAPALFQPKGIAYSIGDYRNPYLEYASQGLLNSIKR